MAFFAAFISVFFMMRWLKKQALRHFVIYRIGLGIGLLGLGVRLTGSLSASYEIFATRSGQNTVVRKHVQFVERCEIRCAKYRVCIV